MGYISDVSWKGVLPHKVGVVLCDRGIGLAALEMNVQQPNENTAAEALRADGGHRTGGIFLLVFAALVIGIVAAGCFSYRHYAQYYRAEVERQLAAIADLKVTELTQWRLERLGDGNLFFKNPSFAALVRRFLEHPRRRLRLGR